MASHAAPAATAAPDAAEAQAHPQDPHLQQLPDAADDNAECPFCVMMRKGGCEATFQAFMDCGARADKGEHDMAHCLGEFNALQECMDRNKEVFDTILTEMSAVDDQLRSGGRAEEAAAGAAAAAPAAAEGAAAGSSPGAAAPAGAAAVQHSHDPQPGTNHAPSSSGSSSGSSSHQSRSSSGGGGGRTEQHVSSSGGGGSGSSVAAVGDGLGQTAAAM